MTRKQINAILVLLSMVYAAVIAVLAITESGALTLVAIIGGAALGISWTAAGILFKQKRPDATG